MEDIDKTEDELIKELNELRQELADVKAFKSEREQVIRALDQRNRDLAFLIQAIQAFISTLRLDQVLNTILEGVRQCLNVAACSVWLIDQETNELVCRQAVGPQGDVVRGWRLAPGEGLAGWVAHSGKSIIVPDTRADKRHYKGVDQHIQLEVRSVLSVPLQLKEKIIGALHVLDTEVDRFGDTELTLLESLAVIAAIAIENAQLYEQAQQEISQRQQTEVALRDSEERFREVIVSVSDHIYVTEVSAEGHPTNLYLSPDIESLTGYPQELFMADRDFWPSIVIHPDDRDAARAHAEQLSVGYDGEIEYRLIRSNGEIIWVRDSARVKSDGKSNIIYGVVSNVTERKQLEEQLYQSQKMEAIGLLAGGVAHNFNNLMTVITGYSELLEGRLSKDDSLRQDVEQIKKAGEQAASLTGQLLAFSRKQVLQPRVLDLNTVVGNMDQMLRPIIGEDIDLTIVLTDKLNPVKADPGQMEQVIMNLVINARDAMPRGGKLTIETANVDLDETYTRLHVDAKPGPHVMLAVSDTGDGMTEETRLHIFEPFFTTKEQGQGTGLGLATVHGIVNQSDGHVWVYSEPGHGTTFKLYLPQIESDRQASRPKAKLVGSSQGSESILLVEDESMVRDLAHRILLDDGYTVLVTRHGEEAIQVCEQYAGPIHLLVTDVVIPGGMSGPELAQRLVALRPDMRVLYMSGYPDKAIVHHGVLDPGTSFLDKPFTPSALTGKVREVLDTK
jgi:PAS domain S-box-containing protein